MSTMSIIYNQRENIVPVVGENCFVCNLTDEEKERFNIQGDTIPLMEYLMLYLLYEKESSLQKLKDKIVELYGPSDECFDEVLNFMRQSPYKGISMLKASGITIEYDDIIYKADERIGLEPTVRNFLETYKFELIITTTIFRKPFKLETRYKERKYNCIKDTEPISGKTIYYLFGINNSGTSFVDDEDKLLVFLKALHDKDTACSSLTNYLKSSIEEKKLLILDSNLPDWAFRFTLLQLSESKGYVLGDQARLCDKRYLTHVSSLSDAKMQIQLQKAIDDYSSNDTEKENIREEYEYKNSIFISHAGEDNQQASDLCEFISKNLRKKVICDSHGEYIKGGDNYLTKIKAGIENSAYYLPLVTMNFLNKHKPIPKGAEVDNPAILEELARNGEITWVQFESFYAAYVREKRIKENKLSEGGTYSIPVVDIDGYIFEHGDVVKFKHFPVALAQTITQIQFGDYADHLWTRYDYVLKEDGLGNSSE